MNSIKRTASALKHVLACLTGQSSKRLAIGVTVILIIVVVTYPAAPHVIGVCADLLAIATTVFGVVSVCSRRTERPTPQ